MATSITRIGQCASQTATADELRKHLEALRRFDSSYRAYLAARAAHLEPLASECRAQLLRQSGRAQRAIDACEGTIASAPVALDGFGPKTRLGELALAFEHSPPEEGAWSQFDDMPHHARDVLDWLATMEGIFEDRIEQVEGNRRIDPISERASRPRDDSAPTVRPEWRRRYTIFGRIERLPLTLSTLADVATVLATVGALLHWGGFI